MTVLFVLRYFCRPHFGALAFPALCGRYRLYHLGLVIGKWFMVLRVYRCRVVAGMGEGKFLFFLYTWIDMRLVPLAMSVFMLMSLHCLSDRIFHIEPMA